MTCIGNDVSSDDVRCLARSAEEPSECGAIGGTSDSSAYAASGWMRGAMRRLDCVACLIAGHGTAGSTGW